jgi:hypothetical protein
VSSSACKPSSTFVLSYDLVSSSDDESEDEDPPPHPLPDESFEPKTTPYPSVPRWVHST